MEVCSTGLLSGGKAVSIVAAGCGHLSVSVWAAESCLAVTGHEVLFGINVQEIVCHLIVSYTWW